MFDALRLRPRLVFAVIIAIVFGFALPGSIHVWSRGLMAWCLFVVAYAGLVVWQFTRASVDDIRKRASRLDDSAPVVLVLSLAATVASVAAIGALLLAPPGGTRETFEVVLTAMTMVLSWCFTQVTFATHYTHIYYGDVDGEERGGLQFGGQDDPDFWDFLYFTTSIGATAQTSDTVVTTRTMRRIVLAQAVYSFFFNTAVLALAINIAAGLAGH